MNQDYTKLLGSILKNMALMDHIRPSEIPNIDLYMDQVIAIAEKYLRPITAEGDNLLTQAMINNYVKNGIVPPPIKKRFPIWKRWPFFRMAA